MTRYLNDYSNCLSVATYSQYIWSHQSGLTRKFWPKYDSLLERIAYAQQKRQNGKDCEMPNGNWF